MNKIFCIGFQKTGTSSMHHALERMGYAVCGTRSDLVREIQADNWAPVWDTVDRYNAFEDHPWPDLYKELDQKYPGSKFILTVRDESKWIQSCTKFFKDKYHFVSEWIYGVGYPMGNEDRYLEVYRRHNREVREYFKDRPGDLLVMDLEQGDGWEQLCPFLGKPVLDEPFAHTNRSDDPGNWYKRSKTVAWILGKVPWLRSVKRALWKLLNV